ncbi:MAG: SIS domain-containing protein [Phycisphaerales bacterium]|nr:SIS domain-containing protein [Phycisphaerales bacterium]
MPFRLEAPLSNARAALDALLADKPTLDACTAACTTMAVSLKTGGKVMICGNGGSSCDANHFAEELTGRFRADRPPIAALACTDAGHITCTANDYGFDHVFSRWVLALGKPGDVLIVLSTSGNSANIVKAVDAAKERGMQTVALLGKSGGALKGKCLHEIVVPGATSDRIQELHMLILHAWCEGIEKLLGY